MTDTEATLDDPAYREARTVLERLARTPEPIQHRDGAAPPSQDPAHVPPAPAAVPRTWSESTLRALLETLPDALVAINPDGVIVLVNSYTEQLFGFRREELLGQAVEVLVPNRFRKVHLGHRAGFFVAPRARPLGVGMDLFGRRKDGSEFPVEISLSPLRTEHGLIVTATIRDVSQRKRQEAKFRTMVETIPAVTFIAPLDEGAPEFYVSPQIEHLLGFSQKEWLEDPVLWHRQLHPDDRERWNLQFAPTCAAGTPFNSIYRFIAKDGRVVWVHGSAQMVRDAEGRPIFLQGIAFDVTMIKEAERALAQMNAELDRRVRERTEELEEKTAELEHFAYVASHDLKGPLRTLKNYPQKLLKHFSGKLDSQADDWINRTVNGANRMDTLITSLANYATALPRARILDEIDCGSAIQGACANLEAALQESAAEVVVGDMPTVLGNREQVMLLFQNLIGNAIKFRFAGRPVRVEVGSRSDEDGWLCWVRDNGIGIEQRHLKKMWGLGVEARFYTDSKYPGTGYGLHICKKIVVGHGGRIWVESEPGQGSTFFFTFPERPLAARSQDPSQENETATQHFGSGFPS